MPRTIVLAALVLSLAACEKREQNVEMTTTTLTPPTEQAPPAGATTQPADSAAPDTAGH